MFDFLFWNRDKEVQSLAEVIAVDLTKLNLSRLEIEKAVLMIAKAIAKSDILIQTESKEKSKQEYRLNIQPNDHECGTVFWTAVVKELLTTTEAVIIPLAGKYYRASSWQTTDNVLTERTYSKVTLTCAGYDYAIYRSFRSSEVIHLRYDNARIRMYLRSVVEQYLHRKLWSIKMRVDAGEDDEENGVTICDTQEQLETALRKKCEEQFESGVDKPKVTIEANMELLQNTELYEDVKELEKVSLGDTVHCNHSKLGIKSDARVIELEWDAVRNKLISVTLGEFQYNFLDDVSSVMSRVDQAIRSDGTLIGQQVQGIINGVKAQLKAQSTIAKKQPVRAILFEDLDSESPTYGAMCLGTLGFEIASERTADGRDWKWTTFGTGQGFYADFIVAGTMLADRIKGGTLILGGKDNGDGTAKVLDANGNVVLALTNQGIVVDHASNGGVLISNGSIFIRNTKGETVGIMHYQDNGMSIQSYGGQYASILITNEGKISINAVGEVSLSCGSLKVGGKSTKTGRAVYSDGTYLDIQNGHVVGGNTKEGSF